MTIYAKIDKVEGGVTAQGFEKQIQLEDVSLGMSRPVAGLVGRMSDRGSGTASFQDVMCTKETDFASSSLLEAAFEGQGVKVILSFMTSGDKPQLYMEVTLENAIISSYSFGGGGQDTKPFESFSFNSEKINIKFVKYDAKGGNPSPKNVGYDLGKGVKI